MAVTLSKGRVDTFSVRPDFNVGCCSFINGISIPSWSAAFEYLNNLIWLRLMSTFFLSIASCTKVPIHSRGKDEWCCHLLVQALSINRRTCNRLSDAREIDYIISGCGATQLVSRMRYSLTGANYRGNKSDKILSWVLPSSTKPSGLYQIEKINWNQP